MKCLSNNFLSDIHVWGIYLDRHYGLEEGKQLFLWVHGLDKY